MSEEPGREARPGTESVPPGAGRVFGGILLVLFGACILFVGGGCTILWLVVLLDNQSWGHESGPGLLLVSLVTAGLGLFAVVKGVQLPRGRAGSNDGGTDA